MIVEVIAIVLSSLAFFVACFTFWHVFYKAKTKVENDLCSRLCSLIADMIMLLIGCFLLSIVIFACVHMFRLWHTGRMLVFVISECSDFLSAAVWPFMILLLVIIYRKHVVNALEKIPKFIENYHIGDKVSAAETSDEDEVSATRHDASSMPSGKIPQETVKGSQKHLRVTMRSNVGTAFANYVLMKLQRELKTPICREVNLFSNRFVCFDGAVVRGSRITGIEVCYSMHSCEKKLLLYEKFYRSLSENDKRHFDLIFCVRCNDAIPCDLENLRDRISFPVEFRYFQYDPDENRETE